ncbi:S1 family peptidase [Dyella sp. A6]|uniref:S1 family peptidase n=1 Tax=Dyella aluminiiresistens TaxID=3069105 RepID=UPI002E761031|nr:trypsin-like peptidase domain-containing protein [Dyella sp. A6]
MRIRNRAVPVVARATKKGSRPGWSGLLAMVIGLCMLRVAAAATLNPAVLPTVQAATFEVVEAKPLHDPLTYEKPLPMDLLPYQQRTDKYYSIGTAFALGHNRYVTAGHVLLAGLGGLWGAPELRDSAGHVYAIDKIEKFDLRRDFVVFSLATQPPGAAALPVDVKPALNQVVYAVGNALGTGVVIRDGLYTSNTPEPLDGRWKWMRFSAAASPGNSGGPLLDHSGKVIGVVLMKSANENLNYALPIGEVLNAPPHKAVIDTLTSYQLDVLDSVHSSRFKATFALPLSYAGFSAAFQKLGDANSDAQLKALLSDAAPHLFPQGDGSRQLLYGQPWLTDFPSLIARNSNGIWGRAGQQARSITLADNGYIAVGHMGHTALFHLRRPDSLPAGPFYADLGVAMTQMAKAGLFHRTIGPERIKITSLGKPYDESTYTDRWQRHWKMAEWSLPFADVRMLVMALPVPDGYVMLARSLPPGHAHDNRLDLKTLTDFVYVDYEGTLAQWKDFLAQKALLPDAFRNIHIDFDYGHRFSYSSQRLAFSFTPAVQKIEPDSLLTLGFSYFEDHGRPVWDVGAVRVWKNRDPNDMNRVTVQRFMQPPADLDDSFQSQWREVSRREHPYDGVARDDDDVMKINAVVAQPGVASPTVLYSVFYGIEGRHPQAFMKARLARLTKNMRVSEH